MSVRGSAVGARLWWGLVPLVILLWGTGAILVASLPGLDATPLATLALVPGLDYALVVAVAITIGAVLLGMIGAAPAVRAWAVGWALVAAGLTALSLAALRADLAGVSPVAADQPVGLSDVLDTWAGRALVVQGCCLLAVAALARLRGRGLAGAALALACIAAAAPAFAGHAGLSGEHAVASLAIGLHAAAASAWVGGVAVLGALLLRDPEHTIGVLPRFSAVALACVIVVAESGLLTASLVVGPVLDLLGTAYGSLVLAKAALLGALVLLGWRQRRRILGTLTGDPDTVASPPASRMSLARLVVTLAGYELLLMGTALAAAVVLARIGPSPIPGTGLAPLTIVVLGLAVPMLVVAVRPGGWRVSNALPEVASIVLLLVVVEVGGVGLLRVLLGPLGLAVEVILLVMAGWLAVSSAGRAALVILGVGMPVCVVVATMLADRPGTERMALVAAGTAVLLVCLWWRRTALMPADVPVPPDLDSTRGDADPDRLSGDQVRDTAMGRTHG